MCVAPDVRPFRVFRVQRCAAGDALHAHHHLPIAPPPLPFPRASVRRPYSSSTRRGALCALISPKVVANVTLRTAGPAHRLHAVADRGAIAARRSDLAYVTVTVVDAAGVPVPDAEVEVWFRLLPQSGPGEVAAVGNGNPTDPASVRAAARRTYRGRCLAILRPGTVERSPQPGTELWLEATSEGLGSAVVAVALR